LFFRVESLTSVMMSGTLFLFGHMAYGTYETNKANVTYGTDGNDMMMEIIILPTIAFYVQIQIF
ncbi:hypothetical protein, partial [uncultured Prevotella sp.]|uniref:hypothetical protein n=1 Tax=uncultured Prevotella sp. TaxID=159272 RepID=UPI0026747E41